MTLQVLHDSEKESVSQDTKIGYIYVVFSSTPYKVGRFIRVMTHSFYNHMSIAADAELKELYSFSRFYRDTPFYAGFVRENPDRFRFNGKSTHIKVCAIPLSAEHKHELISHLRSMQGDNRYIYNMFSAACAPLHHKIRVRDAYTCVEFAVKIMSEAGLNINENRFYAIQELERILEKHVIYVGEYPRPDMITRSEQAYAGERGDAAGEIIKGGEIIKDIKSVPSGMSTAHDEIKAAEQFAEVDIFYKKNPRSVKYKRTLRMLHTLLIRKINRGGGYAAQ